MMYSTAASHGGAAALIEGGQAVTYAALAERAGAIAQTVLNAVSPGERVAIFLRRGTDAAAAFFGVLAAGAVAVIVNETLRSRQIEHILKHADTSLLLTSAELCSHLSRLPVDHVAAIDVADIAPVHDFEPVPRVGADVAQIVYTSGSTGLPKGVTLSHSNLWAGMSAVVSYLGITPTDRIVSLLPFSFDYGLNQRVHSRVGRGVTWLRVWGARGCR
jgi:acyl-CoA synthetase (AMP-forming)/AMP-acid ligase II